MERTEQIAQSRKLLDYITKRTTALADDVHIEDIAAYASPQRAERERRELFLRRPLCMGLSSRLPNPGDWLTEDSSGTPILLVRDRDRTLRAFVNACRHRGARVADGAGEKAGGFTCPYHAWSYGLDGKLRTRPNEAAFAGHDRSQCNLMPLPVAEKYGLMWAAATPGLEFDIDAELAGLGPELASYKFDSYSHYRTKVITPDTNWKMLVDGFLETYHLPHLHKTTVSPLIFGDLGTFDGYGLNTRMIVVRRGFTEMVKLPEEQWDLIPQSAIIYVLFPNTVLIVQGDHVETWHVYPHATDPGACTTYFSLYTPEPTVTDKQRRHWERNFDLAIDTVEKEDLVMSAGMQRGYEAGHQKTIVFGRNEPCLAHFHQSIDRALGNNRVAAAAE
jgi:nitrite reductase/ring-hydroxylating ferredoxin subunit